jgi:hypothetical protein
VGGDRVSESTVNSYLTAQAVPFVTSGGTSVVPRTIVLQTLIQTKLLERALQAHGGAPTSAELSEARAAVLRGTTEAEQIAQLVKYGFKPAFASAYINSFVLDSVLANRLHASSAADIVSALQQLDVPVAVNPRYGSWEPKTFSLGEPQPPTFLTLPSATAPVG